MCPCRGSRLYRCSPALIDDLAVGEQACVGRAEPRSRRAEARHERRRKAWSATRVSAAQQNAAWQADTVELLVCTPACSISRALRPSWQQGACSSHILCVGCLQRLSHQPGGTGLRGAQAVPSGCLVGPAGP